MKLATLVTFALLQGVSCFLSVAPSSPRVAPASGTTAFLFPNNKKNDSSKKPSPKKEDSKPDPRTFQGLLQILVTGSPDGIMLMGKPQHNWLTGKKEYTASKGPKKLNIFDAKKSSKK